MRKPLLLALAGICLVIGVVWTLQGSGVMPGSFMTGETLWLVIGVVLLVVGVVLAGLGLRRPSRRA